MNLAITRLRIGLLALITCMPQIVCAQAPSALPDAFKNIAVSQPIGTTLAAYAYAARPEYSQPTLSPHGTRLALVARLPDSITTLLVLDISGKEVKPLTRLEIPDMKSIQSYGWASEDKLVAWVNMDTSKSSDDDPSSSLYIAQLDLKTKKVTERTQPTKMAADVESPYPLSSDLVRAPWRDLDHVLISECKRQGGVQYKQRGEAANYTFASTSSLPSSTIVCQLLDWDLNKDRASAIAKPYYAYPTRFFANTAGDNFFAEGRKVGGKMAYGAITPSNKKWLNTINANATELQSIWDSSELDYAADWQTIHKILGNRLDPAGEVVKTSNSGQPVGVQFTSPQTRFVPLDATLVAPMLMLNNTFASLQSYQGATIKWLGSTDDKATVLFSVENSTNPGTYFVWRQADNTVIKVTDARSIAAKDLASTYLEPSWLPGYLPVAVTQAKNSKKPKGFVLMPLVIDDAAAADDLHSVDLTAEWFANNGLLVVRVPVGLPAALPEAQRGDAWRKQIAQRLSATVKNIRAEFKLDSDDNTCIYGRDANAYAALAAAAFGSPVTCVIALNPKLDPKIFAQPYTAITTTAKTWYLSSDNVELRTWRSLYGSDLAKGTPSNWTFPATSNVMVGFDMFDEHRTLATYASSLKQNIGNSNGKFTLYTPNVDSAKTDQWLSNLYEAMTKFILPPNLGKVGKVYVGDIEDGAVSK